jgi:hypothetical protein
MTSWNHATRILLKMAQMLMVFACCNVAESQEVLKHPRVVELEDRLNHDATAYIKSRFPEIPFMVVVRVDPIRRESRVASSGREEALPYFESVDRDEEFRDEWDNPQVPLMGLLNRVRKISVKISVPSKLKEVEVNEMREGIFYVLHLTPARDEIDVSRREWAMDEIPWIAVYIAGALLFTMLFGLLVINRSSANRIATALTEMKMQSSNGSSGNSSGAGASNLHSNLQDASSSNLKSSGSHEVKFNDPLKMRELASGLVATLTATPSFPNHTDMFTLDRLGIEAPEKLGAILMEFSPDLQKRLFEYSSGIHWIKAMNEPGFLDFTCLEVLQSMTQNDRKLIVEGADRAVLAVWRLAEERSTFLRSLPREESFAVLCEMPKSIAVAEARKAFPGAWGSILDSGFRPVELSVKRFKEIHDRAVAEVPLTDIASVKRYRGDKELLEYVKTVDPTEERDIYEAAAEDSLIHRLRPPFYPIFQQSERVLQRVVPRVSIDHWAHALFNLIKTDRQTIEKQFSEKQKFMLIERLKRFDAKAPPMEAIALAREFVGKSLNEIQREIEMEAVASQAEVDAILERGKANAA